VYKLLIKIIPLLFIIAVLSAFFGPEDAQPPDIELDDLLNGQTVYTEKVYIAGQVIDDNKIEILTLNKASILNSTGQSIFFSHLAELREGKNIITIEAGDEAGNRAKKDITVIRKNLQLPQLPKEIIDKRMRLAVYPFDEKGTVSDQSSLFMDMLILALQKQNRFQLIERVRMDRVMEEQQLSLTQVIDRNAAVNIGKLMSAQAIITGSIIETRRGIEMVGRMIDTETSKILATEKIYCKTGDLTALKFLAESMTVKFHNDFPMLRGIVIKRKDRHIFTNLGQDNIPLHGRLIIYRENGPETGRASGAESIILGYARVTQVFPDMSKAELIKGRLDEIKELDRIIIQ
jgi:TolB-like protein